jgi:hypothetical protein
MVEGTLFALEESRKNIRFKKVIIVTHEKPASLPDDVKFEVCEVMNSIVDYNRYIIYNLHKHIDTEYCLLIQHDGYVVRPEKWQDCFLEWDYIGAPWPIKENAYIDPFGDHIRVGNGGFSLRSKKLLEVPLKTKIEFEVNIGEFYKHMNANSYSEDGNICVHNRHIFKEFGCRFAPVELAAQFSQECDTPEIVGIDPFGFHAKKR